MVLDLTTPSSDRVAAVATLKARGDQDAQSLIDQVAAQSDDPAVKTAALNAEAAIKAHLVWLNVLQNLIYGVSAASVLLLAAIGLAITFGVMGVINMAHGEMVMLGAYTTFVVQSALPPSFLQWSLAVVAAARVPGFGHRRHRHRAPASSAISTAGRWRRCSPPGVCR